MLRGSLTFISQLPRKDTDDMKVFVTLALLLPAFATAAEVKLFGLFPLHKHLGNFSLPIGPAKLGNEGRWWDEHLRDSSVLRVWAVPGNSKNFYFAPLLHFFKLLFFCLSQEYSLDFSQQADAEGCHSFCGKVDGCNWWSWEPAQSLCLVFDNCTELGPPNGVICPDCISGEKLWV